MMKVGKVGKQRSRSAAKKRVKRTNGGTGKYVMDKSAHNHLLLQKSKKQKAKAKKAISLSQGESAKMSKMLI